MMKRLNYFHGELLDETDFKVEQDYHLEMRRIHNRRLHTAGIAWGLEVTPGIGKVTVGAGMAINELGQEMIVDTPPDKPQELKVDVAPAVITISYHEEPTDIRTESTDTGEGSGFSGPTRYTETGILNVSATPDPASVVLAKVTAIGADGLVILDTAFRPEYCAPMVKGDLRVEGAIFTGHSSGKLKVEAPVEITGELKINGNLLSNGNVGIGTAEPVSRLTVDIGDIPYQGIEVRDSSGRWTGLRSNSGNGSWNPLTQAGDLALIYSGGTKNTGSLVIGQWSDAAHGMRIDANGNVGIGTAEPTRAKLEVSGRVGATVGLFGKGATGIALTADWPTIGMNAYYNGGWKSIWAGWTGLIELNQQNGSMNFYVAGQSTGADQSIDIITALTITKDGHVGIGTSPSYPLDVNGDMRANRYRGLNSLTLNDYQSVNPPSNVCLYSSANDRDSWLFLDSADTTSNWGIYHRQIDSTVKNLPANSIGFIGGGNSDLKAYVCLGDGSAYLKGNVGIGTTDTSKGRLVVEGIVAAAAFVGNGIVPQGVIAMWSGKINNIPSGWAICDGQNGTPDLRDRFVLAAGRAYMPDDHGGPDSHLHPISSFKITTDTDGAHQHRLPINWHHRSFEDGGYTGIDVGGSNQNIEFTEATFGAHAHWIRLPDWATISNTSEIRPRWYALLYIMKL